MALELTERLQPGIVKSGSETVEIIAGQWLQVRYGAEGEPTTMLEAQVPAGKKWTVNVFVDLLEQDA